MRGREFSLHRKIPCRITVAFHAQTSRGHEVFQHLGDALFAGGGVAAFEAEAERLGRDRSRCCGYKFAHGEQLVEGFYGEFGAGVGGSDGEVEFHHLFVEPRRGQQISFQSKSC
jgi:hypothetical protein